MKDLFELYQYIKYICNKEQRGFKYKPSKFNSDISVVNFEYFKLKYGLPEQFRVGMPFSAQAYELVQQNKDNLARFLVIMGDQNSPMLIDQYGHAQLPSNYLHVSSIGIDNYISNEDCTTSVDSGYIEVLTDAKFRGRLGSKIASPTKEDPICRFMSSYIQFAPKDLGSCEFVYLRKPIQPVFAYTAGVDDNIVYNPSASTQFEWNELEMGDIASMLLSKIGITLRSEELVGYAERLKKEGV